MPPTTVVKTPLSSDGTCIYAEAAGDPRNRHIVFIHEATLCSIVFDNLFQDSRLTDHLFMVSFCVLRHVLAFIGVVGAVRSPLPWQKWHDERCRWPSRCVLC